jgi:DNA-binding Lrp family transcriptional regulator
MVVAAAEMGPEIRAQVAALDCVTEAHVVAGDFDVIAELEGDTPRELMKAIATEIQALEGVGHTRTYVVLD